MGGHPAGEATGRERPAGDEAVDLKQRLATPTETSCPATVGARTIFPASIQLPAGHYPEGIASGKGLTFYVGSLARCMAVPSTRAIC